MTIDTETTLVTFYKEWNEEDDTENVLAYFPLEITRNGNMRACYSDLEKHTDCSPDYVKDLPLATKKEYTELLNELKGLGYNLKVI